VAEPDRPLLVWVDAQIPPAASQWIEVPGKIQAIHVFDLDLGRAEDSSLFDRARSAGAVVLTKDHDFVQLQERRGVPPKIVWLTCGNVSNRQLRHILSSRWPRAAPLPQTKLTPTLTATPVLLHRAASGSRRRAY
jgi:predicted nuclease of predicted toxin-antitoxin system